MLRPWDFNIRLERRGRSALHVQIAQAVMEEIRRGRLPAGAPMPGSRDLAGRLDVNRKTVVLAYDELIAQGWLDSQGRRGTFVSARLSPAGGAIARKALSHARKVDSTATRNLITIDDGAPDARMIPYAALSRAFRHAVIATSRHNRLGYGDPCGTDALRSSLANMLNMERGLACNEDAICLVRGSQMGIYIAARALVRPGDCAVFESLSYAPARDAFSACGAKILCVRQDSHGLVPEDLERLCRAHKVRAVYVTPHHQYPTTVMLPADRRLRLLALAEQFDFQLIEDDYDHEFHFDHRPVLPIASMDRADRVVYVGSLSKGLAPGLRVGYIAATPAVVDQCARVIMHVDRQGNTVVELAVNELLASGELKRHLRRASRIYAGRRDAAVDFIQRELADHLEFDIPPGGLALWLRLRRQRDARPLMQAALAQGLRLVSGEHYSVGAAPVSGLRAGYGSLDVATFRKGMKRLAAAFAAIRQ